MACIAPAKDYFFFNLDAHVGSGQTNHPDDVELVRLAYVAMSRNQAHPADPSVQPLLAVLRPNGPFGPDLDAVIRAHEKANGGAQDGRVSPLPQGYLAQSGYYDGSHAWIMVILCNHLRSVFTSFPRIDLAPECGPALAMAVRKMFVGH